MVKFNNGISLRPLSRVGWQREKATKPSKHKFCIKTDTLQLIKKDYIVFKTYGLKTYKLTDTGLKIMAQFNFLEFYQGLTAPASSNLFCNSMDSGGGKFKRVCSQKKGSDLSFQSKHRHQSQLLS